MLFGLAYPGLVYLALRVMEPRQVAWVALGVVGTRALIARRGQLGALLRLAGPLALLLAAALVPALLWNDPLGILLTPALVSSALLIGFARSLLQPPSVVEQMARLEAPDLGEAEVRYCRRVTALWCGFFLVNAAVSAALATGASRALWAAYTGGLAYLAVGLLFGSEYLYRHWRFRRYVGGPFDTVLRRVFPPAAEAERAGGARSAVEAGLEPEVIAERSGEGTIELDLRVPEELDCWPGHFPGDPVLPGVLQLRWVMAVLGRACPTEGPLTRVEALKFRDLIRPGEALNLRIETRTAGREFAFVIERGGRTVAEGRLRFGRGTAG